LGSQELAAAIPGESWLELEAYASVEPTLLILECELATRSPTGIPIARRYFASRVVVIGIILFANRKQIELRVKEARNQNRTETMLSRTKSSTGNGASDFNFAFAQSPPASRENGIAHRQIPLAQSLGGGQYPAGEVTRRIGKGQVLFIPVKVPLSRLLIPMKSHGDYTTFGPTMADKRSFHEVSPLAPLGPAGVIVPIVTS
jgi:hypothetical protein